MRINTLLSRLSAFFVPSQSLYCPLCKKSSKEFLTFGVRPRKNAMCPHCHSLERHRLFWLYLKHRTDIFSANLSVLDVAPQRAMNDIFLTMPNLKYTSIDVRSAAAERQMDLTNLSFSDSSFDYVFCFHVLEHISDDKSALREMYRVLKPGGIAALQSFVRHELPVTYEDPTITDPKERLKHFYQEDHVRVYGRDYGDRLRAAGFEVNAIPYAQELGPAVIQRCALRAKEILYICRKPL